LALESRNAVLIQKEVGSCKRGRKYFYNVIVDDSSSLSMKLLGCESALLVRSLSIGGQEPYFFEGEENSTPNMVSEML
jgi:hypothetical protein